MNLIQRYFLLTFFLLLSFESQAAPLIKIFPEGLRPNGFWFTLIVIGALITTLAVHELGHLLTGLAQGFRFELFVVFLLGVKRDNNRIKVYLNKNIGYMGGVAATTPHIKSPENRKKLALLILAGPVASLLFSIICFLLVVYTRNMMWSFWLIAGAASIGIFLATTLPTKSGVFFTDRARFQRLLSKGKEGKAEEALLSIMAQTNMDNSVKNISLDDTQALKDSDEAFIRFWGYYYTYQYYLANEHTEKIPEAKAELLNVKDSVPKQVWKALGLE